ncbi:GNAT family N-acetyltransferase [Pontiella agarivorans]|uniref:GNAT family N-acetyltransferase n=1 Tax=Pontiella agarivorans TaxID=3038953 RepID=A0ABU5MXD5_9BACT|nr:GNAT family N-acetyltransferase [Pontiella agarivorans]MDZ8118864.1 GNAT family N-acetyltransferase [Pontiella agarivorans]
MQIQLYRNCDCDKVIEIYRTAALYLGRQAYTDEQVQAWATYPEDPREFRRTLLQGLTLCAVEDGIPVAFGQLNPTDHIAFLYCHPRFARRGYASSLLHKLESAALKQNAPLIRTEASAISRPLFEKNGFRVLAEERPVRRGIEFLRYRMEKTLSRREKS